MERICFFFGFSGMNIEHAHMCAFTTHLQLWYWNSGQRRAMRGQWSVHKHAVNAPGNRVGSLTGIRGIHTYQVIEGKCAAILLYFGAKLIHRLPAACARCTHHTRITHASQTYSVDLINSKSLRMRAPSPSPQHKPVLMNVKYEIPSFRMQCFGKQRLSETDETLSLSLFIPPPSPLSLSLCQSLLFLVAKKNIYILRWKWCAAQFVSFLWLHG